MHKVVILLLFLLFGAMPASGQVMKASLKGSRESMVRQNQMANEEDLTRLRSKNQILTFLENGYLVSLAEGFPFKVESGLPIWRQAARPWTAGLLSEVSDSLKNKFNKSLLISSCVRDFKTQKRLRRQLGKGAAKTNGPLATTHFTGSTCDISQKTLSYREKAFIRKILLTYEKLCLVEATEHGSSRNRHFHVFVSKRYETGEICIPKFKMPKIVLKTNFPAVQTKYALHP
jgi:hypothetical protein